MKRFFIAVALTSVISIHTKAQQSVNDSTYIIANVKKHIVYLASDELMGRETGTDGEEKARNYIIENYKSIGLTPVFENNFLQSFPFTKGRTFGKNNELTINKERFEFGKDFTSFLFGFDTSGTGTIVNAGFGIDADSLGLNDYKNIDAKGKILLMDLMSPDGNNPHGKFGEHANLEKKVETAMSKGAVGIIFYTEANEKDILPVDLNIRRGKQLIPVVMIKGKNLKALKKFVGKEATIRVDLPKIEAIGNNVVGFLNNNAQTTIVISAHYDHLGLGEHGSLHRGSTEIHNGADDNASGTAALMELARLLKQSEYKANNYLFCAFSGEEMGLLGSKYFVEHATPPLAQINYNLNMDMVGRLKPEEPVLIINGVGTSPNWLPALNNITHLKVKTTESGVAPSDNTSFYLNGVPAIHFFSGTHSDYHKPSDDEDKINYSGEYAIIKYIYKTVGELNDDGKLPFVKTNDATNENTPRFKVTLGVVPDYAFEGEGMRIDGVTDGKPASKAGLVKGDIVIQLGEEKISDMQTYMKALSKFSKGQTTIVKAKRGEAIVENNITF
ncbi:MAG: M28 family peptidase [Bacteroidetes bacterium]|nr:M28 family peptidase [Bacteroidota bacterium]